MTTLNRRKFMQLGGAGTTALGLGLPVIGHADQQGAASSESSDVNTRVVRLSGDGLGLTAAEYSRLLARLSAAQGFSTDSYSLGGVVERLEGQFASLLGKERAIFMPTGTLANHLAVRALAGGPSRVLVQEQSHLYQDEGDCAQTLSNLTLMPLAPGRATFTADDVQRVIDDTRGSRVVSRVSVISIETPVRRKQGERFDSAEMQKIIALARREGLKLHLDGARLFLQAAYTGETVADTARPFDTVYISLYKYFNAASGAILAGPRDLLDGMYHVRRMFGGGLSSVWPFAAVALHYLPGFSDRFGKAARTSEDLVRELGKRDGFTIERMPSGTNYFRLKVAAKDPAAFRSRLAARAIMLPAPQRDTFVIGVNETLNRMSAAELADAIVSAL